jgi:hypothetical protein
MKNLKIGITTIILILGINQHLSAQEVSTNEKTKFSIEIDPATFAFNGYGIHFRLQPKGCEHLLVGFGTYAMDLPDLLVNFNNKNKDEGWNVRINQGYSLFAEHHFTEVNRNWFVGTQIGIQEFKIENSNITGSEKFTNILTMGYFGYTIKPFKNNLYIKPWAGIGYTSKISGKNTLETLVYDIAPLTMFATLHIGYTFK